MKREVFFPVLQAFMTFCVDIVSKRWRSIDESRGAFLQEEQKRDEEKE